VPNAELSLGVTNPTDRNYYHRLPLASLAATIQRLAGQ
jgi:hypothetical protein